MSTRGRALTFDELLAAEAAFRGEPLEPGWSQSAQAIYFGILAVTQGRDITLLADRLPDEARVCCAQESAGGGRAP